MSILLADIGGTNVRFKWLKRGRLGKLISYRCDDFKTPYEAIKKVMTESKEKLTGIILAGAGLVQNGALIWTNRPEWQVSEKELQKKYHIKKAIVVNDVQAQGEGLKTIYDCQEISVLMTAGTGLGGCFIVNGQVMPGEVGQVKTEEGFKVEDFISGPGIVRLYHSFGGNKKIDSARQIDALRKKDKIAYLTYQTFYQEWGKFSANLATAFYATGGIYLWGGMVPKNEQDWEVLLQSFEKTLPEPLKEIPLYLVKDKNLAFKGLARLSQREFGQS